MAASSNAAYNLVISAAAWSIVSIVSETSPAAGALSKGATQ
jgi:hypothetical protein